MRGDGQTGTSSGRFRFLFGLKIWRGNAYHERKEKQLSEMDSDKTGA